MRPRVLASLALFLLIPLVPATVNAASAAAAPNRVDEVVLIYFPHRSPAVEFANDWGLPRPGGRRHVGTDIFSPKMTEVVAVADGIVERVRVSRRAGVYVAIRHADGWVSWYLHLNNDTPGTDDGKAPQDRRVLVEVGDFVKAGQVIGFVGDSGNAEHTTPHTHFELHHNGRRVNPYPHLKAAWERTLTRWETMRAGAR